MKMTLLVAIASTRRWAVSFICLAVVCVAALAPARADTRSGLAAFQAGRFSEAFQAWREAADHGDATAALYLGVLYDTGIGVPQSPGRAMAWYQRGGRGRQPDRDAERWHHV